MKPNRIPYRACTLVLAGAIAAIAAPSMAWRATNNHTVNPLSATSFEVIGRGGISSIDYWCAAGDYARRALGAPLDQRIYISRARGEAETENAKSAVQFSLEPPVGSDLRPAFLLTVTRIGDNLSAWAAWNYCLPQTGAEG
ncbi:hypothetical protein [Sedimentitalea todarodis]|uniref:Uncharacterized protein n=1 Tax=Sedimentitalea todarodis TaxID=1631240 RepID=A0ABU3VBH4_9RHOB|nr:hypothetical protein [Sedimentitalea todarodis]MDU9003504.1 hypothetical protein [Sedimentitalea todarodis]